MTFERQFFLASHGLALIGVLGLALTDEVSLVYVVIALACLGWSAWRTHGGQGFDLDSRVANAASLGLLAIVVVRVANGSLAPIRGIAEFLLVLLALKMIAPKADRDWMQIYVLAFFDLVAASALTVELTFATVFLAYLLLAPWVMTLFHLRREVAAAGEEHRLREEAFVDASLFRGIVGVTVVLFLSTLAVFVFFPRMGAGFFANPLGRSSGLSGFSDSVELGDVASLQLDSSVAMRVAVDPPDAIRGMPRYWRGAVLDDFDGRKWSRTSHRYRPLDRVFPSGFYTGARARERFKIREEFILEAMDVPAILVLGRPLEIRGRFAGILMDELGNLRGAFPPSRIRYDVVAALDGDRTPPTPGTLELPKLDPRIREFAEERTAGAGNAAARANALLQVFRKGFRYSLEPNDVEGADPLARFLFETRVGHCEYFASSLAVLLRAVGIPARIANGYRGGEWNEYGGYFVVRQSDAHSWVEAWIDGEWQTLDSTPAGAPSAPSARLSAWIDAARMRWYRYVVNYGASDQVEMAFAVRDGSRRLWQTLGAFSLSDAIRRWRAGERSESRWPLVALAAVLLGAVVFAWRRRSVKRVEDLVVRPGTEEYRRLLALLGKRGLQKGDADTADEFYERISSSLGSTAPPVAELTALYQAARFSGDAATAEDSVVAMAKILAELPSRQPSD